MEIEKEEKRFYDLAGIKLVIVGWVFELVIVCFNHLSLVIPILQIGGILMIVPPLFGYILMFIGVYKQRKTNQRFRKSTKVIVPAIVFLIIVTILAIPFYSDFGYDFGVLYKISSGAEWGFLIFLSFCVYNFFYGCRIIAEKDQNLRLIAWCKRAVCFFMVAILISRLLREIPSFIFSPIEEEGYMMVNLVAVFTAAIINLVCMIPVIGTLCAVHRMYHGKVMTECTKNK